MRVVLLDLDAGPSVDRLRSALEHEGHRVDVVTESAAATWLAQDDTVALVLVCAHTPTEDVVTWCRSLRTNGHWVPVTVVLDSAEPHHIVDVLDAGADDAVTRPVRLTEITARARALTRRALRGRPARLHVGDLHLDPASHRVWRDDEEVHLTPKEFELLEALMQNAGRVLTRDALMECAWSPEAEPASNVIDQYVGRLRRLIDAPFQRDDLQTVRGVGYRLRAS